MGSDNFLLFAVSATHPAPTPTATPIPAPTAAPTPPTVTTASGNQYFTQDGLTSTPASRQADPPRGPNALATIGLLGEYSGTLKGDGNGHTGPMALAITLANVKKRAIFCLMKIEKEEPNTFMGTGPANGGDTFTIERTEGKGVITFVFVPTVDGLRGNWSMTSPNTPTITGTCSLTKTKED